MKFALARQVFLDGLNQVVNIVASRPAIPILSNVMLEAGETGLKMAATNMDMTVVSTVPARTLQPGSITLPAKKLQSIIRELQDGEVQVEVNKTVATIKCNRAQFKLHGLPPDDFPHLPVFKETREFKVPQAMLSNAFRCTEYAMSLDSSRNVLNGIYTSFRDGKLTLVATDGRRLALYEDELEFPESQQTDVILPCKAVMEIHRLLGDAGDAHVTITETQAAFELGDTLLVTRLTDGNYPNYRQVIPSRYNERVSLPTEEFLEIVRRVSLLSSEKTNTVRFHFTEGELTVLSSTTEIGEAQEEMPLDYQGREFIITFNADFMIAPLKAISEETVTFDLIDQSSPGVMRVADKFLYVLMPMHG